MYLFCFSASDQSPATIVDTSSPEVDVVCEETETIRRMYPGLRLISHEDGTSEGDASRECSSPEVPIVCPIPVKRESNQRTYFSRI